MSIATFSFYFDIYNKRYWKEMLDAIGISESQLPKLCEPCTVAGDLLPVIREKLGLEGATRVNVGTLDHFAGMIGTGNIAPGGITLSTGTVMALATMCGEPTPKSCGCAMHYGFLPNTWVMLPVAESGGVSLEWFRRSCMKADYDEMNRELAKRQPNELLFLPYLVGTNAPEFDPDATGVFWGLRQEHDAIDMAGAVMEGVSFVLRKNCEHIAAKGVKLERIIATGGGAKSPIWCQLQADITGLPVCIPAEKEAACLGAAMICGVSDGRFATLEEAVATCVGMNAQYEPHPSARLDRKFRRFHALYEAALNITKI
jgi:sugar (pentulose or hexulose) kinase